MRTLETDDVVISIRQVFLDLLFEGQKCVELRRRPPSIHHGARIWLYSKLPIGKLVGVAILDEIVTMHPRDLWLAYSSCAGISEEEFFRYFAGVNRGAAISFKTVSRLKRPIPLSELRTLEPGFQPPQFFQRVYSSHLLAAFELAEVERPLPLCDH
jgi:predicted transcriptional regulator